MNHEELRESLSEFRDGELAEAERAEMERHLAACEDCRALLERYAEFARALPKPAPVSRVDTERFARSVLARLEPAARRSWWAPALVFGLAAAVLALAVPYYQEGDPTDALLAYQDNGRTFNWLTQAIQEDQ